MSAHTPEASHNAPNMKQQHAVLNDLHLKNLEHVWWNLPIPTLYEHALRNREGHLSHGGALLVRHDDPASLAAHDTYIVDDPLSVHAEHQNGEQSAFKQRLSETQFEALFDRMRTALEGRQLYVEDLLIAAQSGYDQPVRLISQHAWHCLFAKNIFTHHTDDSLESIADAAIKPDDSSSSSSSSTTNPPFTIIHAPHCRAIANRDGMHSESFVLLHPGQRIALIGGTACAGDIKDTICAIMAYVLADSDVLPLHAAAYVAEDGEAALLLGPEGSGKTTLISDPSRSLLGDDALGWSEQNLFNFEAGCYANTSQFDQPNEALIGAASQSFGSILENTALDMHSRHIHFDERVLNHNSRAAFALSSMQGEPAASMLNKPKHLVLLACDALGVLPAISRLTVDQVMYYYLLGYASQASDDEPPGSTSELAASVITTSDGSSIKLSFNPCCGMPLMAHAPSFYAQALAAKVRQGNVQCWLLNTGWSGGPAGIGKRMSIELTRTLLNAALNGNLDKLDYQTHPVLGMQMPAQLDPLSTWHDQHDPDNYINAARQLAVHLKAAFAPFAEQMPDSVRKAGPR